MNQFLHETNRNKKFLESVHLYRSFSCKQNRLYLLISNNNLNESLISILVCKNLIMQFNNTVIIELSNFCISLSKTFWDVKIFFQNVTVGKQNVNKF